jgi:hypothetical protein
MNKEIEISNFVDPKVTALVGRDNGELLLKKIVKSGLNFDQLEKENEKIFLIISPKIVTMNKSFFLGAFEERVIKLGEIGFLKKYEFRASDHIKDKILKHIKFAVLKSTQQEILDV